ncbi:MAG: hypothetical protein AAFZ91_05850 [Pseudomonadota bacterium]
MEERFYPSKSRVLLGVLACGLFLMISLWIGFSDLQADDFRWRKKLGMLIWPLTASASIAGMAFGVHKFFRTSPTLTICDQKVVFGDPNDKRALYLSKSELLRTERLKVDKEEILRLYFADFESLRKRAANRRQLFYVRKKKSKTPYFAMNAALLGSIADLDKVHGLLQTWR